MTTDYEFLVPTSCICMYKNITVWRLWAPRPGGRGSVCLTHSAHPIATPLWTVCTKFCQNWSGFVEDVTKTFLCVFRFTVYNCSVLECSLHRLEIKQHAHRLTCTLFCIRMAKENLTSSTFVNWHWSFICRTTQVTWEISSTENSSTTKQ